MSLQLPKPPLGWNSFDSFGGYLYEEAAFAQLEAFSEKLAPHGYEYFVVDIGWYGEYELVPGTKFPSPNNYKHAGDIHLDEWARPQPSRCYFPNGFGALADRIHELGLKFGIHMMRGIPRKAVELDLPIKGSFATAADIANTDSTCVWGHYNYGINMAKEGAQAYYDSLVELFASWEVDFIKADDITSFPAEVDAYAIAIEKCNRPMVLSLSHGGEANDSFIPTYRKSDMVRITKDIWDDVESIDRSFNAWAYWREHTKPGFWPDLDMIPFGDLQTLSPEPSTEVLDEGINPALCGKGWARPCQLNLSEKQTFITQRALSASPLFPGGDNVTLSKEDIRLLTHPKMLECNQNGISAEILYMIGDAQVWRAEHRTEIGKGWLGVFNRDPSRTPERITLTPDGLKLNENTQLFDIWHDSDLGTLGEQPRLVIPPTGVFFIEYNNGAL